MRINEILSERRIQDTAIMYHGTSSVFLRSILKQGLLPNPGQTSWDGGGEMISLGGVYMAPQTRTALKAGQGAVEKHGGEIIIIEIQSVYLSGTPDEDQVFDHILELVYQGYRRNYAAPDDPKTIFNSAILRLKHSFTLNQQAVDKIKNFIQVAIQVANKLNLPKDLGLSDASKKLVVQPEIRALMLDILNSLKVVYKKDSKYDIYNRNVRITRPIGFRGKTRIIKIYNYNTKEVYYSDPSISNEPQPQ
jgi:ribosomal protein L13